MDVILERFMETELSATLLLSDGQNGMNYPDKLLFIKGKLYKFQEGKLVTKKQKDFCTKK